jgi:hypothetical protein
MLWYVLLKKFSILATICSVIITVLSLILFYLELENPRNSRKLVEETSLAKYINITLIGTIFTMIFGVIMIISKAF